MDPLLILFIALIIVGTPTAILSKKWGIKIGPIDHEDELDSVNYNQKNYRIERKEPIRSFESDADKFSTEQIWEYMEGLTSSSVPLPPVKPCGYVEKLILQLSNEKDIEITEDETKNNVRVIQLAISHNGMQDYVVISYMQFNPNVIYITTNPYFFAGDKNSFIAYSRQITNQYPMISIGCRDYEPEETGFLTQPGYTVRTCIPLLEYCIDFENLLTVCKVLPIYGYDLRDGYHQGNIQPYASERTGINLQLEKIIKIHLFNSAKDLYPAEVGLYGEEPFNNLSTENGAVISNPFLQYLNFANSPKSWILEDNGTETTHFRMEVEYSSNSMKRIGNSELITYTNYPSLYTVKITSLVNRHDVNLEDLFDYMSGLTSNEIAFDAQEYMLFDSIILTNENYKDFYLLKLSTTQCIPNEINAKVIAMQITNFFKRIGEPIEFFKPPQEE